MLIIHAGLLIDGTGSTPKENMGIVIKDKKISAIENYSEISLPKSADVISANSFCVLPGLIDCHVHLVFNGIDSSELGEEQNIITEMLPGTIAYRCYLNARENLLAGFTSVRDMHCFDFVDISLRDMINDGDLEGPRISACGYGLTSTNGHMDYTKGLRPDISVSKFNNVVDDPYEARKAVRQLIKMGVDHIKINVGRGHQGINKKTKFAPEMQFDVIQAICEEAHYAGRKVAAHSLGGLGELWAVQAGVDSLEHAHFVDNETLSLMAEKGTILIPTMTHCVRNAKLLSNSDTNDQDEEPFMSFAYRSMYNMLEKATKFGVRIGVGTDAGADNVKHGSNASELEYLLEVGFTEMDAIVAATMTNAELIGLQDEIGSITPGKYADLLVVDGNPLEDIRVLQDKTRIKKIIKNGRIIA